MTKAEPIATLGVSFFDGEVFLYSPDGTGIVWHKRFTDNEGPVGEVNVWVDGEQ